jgi:hypothetical protein
MVGPSFESRFASLVFGPGSTVTVRDNPTGKNGLATVVGMTGDGDLRVIEFLDGTRATVEPQYLGLRGRNIPPEQDLRLKDFAATEADASEARARNAKLIEKLRSKQTTVTDLDFTPDMFQAKRMPESVVLEGGPFSEVRLVVTLGSESYSFPAANPDQTGNPFVTATYKRSKRRKDGMAVFEFASSAA